MELLDRLTKSFAYDLASQSEPEEEALKAIRAQGEGKTPQKFVLFAGAFHTRTLEGMLVNDGFTIQQQIKRNFESWVVDGKLRVPFTHCLTEEEVDVFGITEPAEQEALRPRWWKRILFCG